MAPKFPLAAMPRHEQASPEQSGRRGRPTAVIARQLLHEGKGHRRNATSPSLSEACVICAFLVRARSRLRSDCASVRPNQIIAGLYTLLYDVMLL